MKIVKSLLAHVIGRCGARGYEILGCGTADEMNNTSVRVCLGLASLAD